MSSYYSALEYMDEFERRINENPPPGEVLDLSVDFEGYVDERIRNMYIGFCLAMEERSYD